ncbi:HAMP domain-containing sensor histidine kinase [Amycolatopsis kentuckyensis]|uniref:HAMP domain-containing sensor histidine kinase n=1 Tax=Amycolatopsis kentuckyensis TaxID=218823 RepID=UPI000A35F85A|nr:HAMP domain-containing sensor histidine kinase [Amycolatopsis kentuckyensis]
MTRARSRPRSLRHRLVLTGGLVALVTVLAMNVLAVGGFAVYQQIRNRRLIDANRMYQVARIAYAGAEPVTSPGNSDEDGVVLVLRPDGAVAERAGVRSGGFEVPGAAELRAAAADGRYRFFGLFYGVVDRVDGGRFVITARALGEQLAVAARMAGAMAVLDVVVCALAMVVAASLFRRTLRPLESFAATAARITAGAPGGRVDLTGVPAEVCQLGTAMNRMLARLEVSFARLSETDDRLRRFVSDAGHELRTPLTVIIGYAQLLRLGVLADHETREQAMVEVEREARRLTALADHLLLLARIDEGPSERSGPIDLDALCREVVEANRAAHPEHPAGYRCEGEPPVVSGDEPWLRQAVSCLLANVGMHTPAGTRAEVVLRTEGADAVLDVVDEGPGIGEADRERVFERFFRCDEARKQVEDRRSAGLGLSIVHSVVTACAGTVEVRPAERGTWIRVRLPVSRRNDGRLPQSAH